jgi:hypothetical protein
VNAGNVLTALKEVRGSQRVTFKEIPLRQVRIR